MLRLCLLCLVVSVSALKISKPVTPLAPVLKLRGGELATPVAAATTAIWGVTGASMFVGTEQLTSALWLGLNKFPHDKYIGMAMIGWAIGKVHALMEGPESTKNYLKLNCIPLAVWLFTNLSKSAPITTSIIPLILFALHVYAGFIE